MHGPVLYHTPSHLPTHEQMANGAGSADDQTTPSSVEMQVRIKGTRAALVGWEPDILGLSMRWPSCQMKCSLDSQSDEWGHRDRGSEILWWGPYVGRHSGICCWWSAGGAGTVAYCALYVR